MTNTTIGSVISHFLFFTLYFLPFTCRKVVVSELVFLLPCSAKARYTLEVANHTSGMIHILAVALWALKECTLIYMVAFITDCNTNVKTEIVTTR